MLSTVCLGGADPTNNKVTFNHVSNNLPGDITYDGTGSNNQFRFNSADVTDVPPAPCGP